MYTEFCSAIFGRSKKCFTRDRQDFLLWKYVFNNVKGHKITMLTFISQIKEIFI